MKSSGRRPFTSADLARQLSCLERAEASLRTARRHLARAGAVRARRKVSEAILVTASARIDVEQVWER